MIIPYHRSLAVDYATKWALTKNPRFFNFDKLGGDCTNFVSQCLLAGKCIMNYTKTFGWYYTGLNNYSPSWTGVNFLYKFLTSNKVAGPFANEIDMSDIEVGDIVQLNFQDDTLFEHSLVITSISYPINYSNILICSHTRNRLNEPLSSINFAKAKFLHIMGSYK